MKTKQVKAGDKLLIRKINGFSIKAEVLETTEKWLVFMDMEYPEVGLCRYLRSTIDSKNFKLVAL